MSTNITPLANQIKTIADSIIAADANQQNSSLPAIITFPVPNRVFQKASGSGGTASFKPTWRGNADTAILKSGTTVVATANSTQNLTAPPGWYDLVLVTAGVEGDSIKVGIGDVYLCYGQSNTVSPLQPSNFVLPTISAGKIIVSDYNHQGIDAFIDCGVTVPDTSICWFYAAINLNRSYPVMFVNVAFGNKSTTDLVNYPYMARLFTSWAIYNPNAILWIQGESDAVAGFSQSTSFNNMDAMVGSLRQVTTVPWVMAKNSVNGGYAAIRAAQQQIIDKWTPVYQGPDTDTFRNPSLNSTNEFFAMAAQNQLQQVGNAFAASIISYGF